MTSDCSNWSSNARWNFPIDRPVGSYHTDRALVLRIDAAGKLSRARPLPGGGILVPATVARPGILIYMGADGKPVREYRPPEECFGPEVVASFRSAAVTVGHPPEKTVTKATWKKYSVGHIAQVNETPVRVDGEDWLPMDLAVQEADAQSRVDAQDLTEVSLGFSCDIDPTPGVVPAGQPSAGQPYDCVQRNVRGNHIALLRANSARAGSGARLRLDSSNNVVDDEATPERPTIMRKVKVDGIEYEAGSDSHIQAVDAQLARNAAELAKEKTRADKAETDLAVACARADKAEADLKTEKAKPSVKTDALVEEELAFRASVTPLLGASYTFKDKSRHDVRLDALKLLGAKVPEGKDKDEAFVGAYFQAAVDLRQTTDSRTDSFSVVRKDSNDPIAAKRAEAQREIK